MTEHNENPEDDREISAFLSESGIHAKLQDLSSHNQEEVCDVLLGLLDHSGHPTCGALGQRTGQWALAMLHRQLLIGQRRPYPADEHLREALEALGVRASDFLDPEYDLLRDGDLGLDLDADLDLDMDLYMDMDMDMYMDTEKNARAAALEDIDHDGDFLAVWHGEDGLLRRRLIARCLRAPAAFARCLRRAARRASGGSAAGTSSIESASTRTSSGTRHGSGAGSASAASSTLSSARDGALRVAAALAEGLREPPWAPLRLPPELYEGAIRAAPAWMQELFRPS